MVLSRTSREGSMKIGENEEETRMEEHTWCPLCRHDNPPENRFCGRCGASLISSEQLPVPRREGRLTAAGRALPARLKPVGKALAVTLAALAAETSLAWLSRRAERTTSSRLPTREVGGTASRGHLVGLSLEEVFVQVQEGDFRSRGFARRVIRSFDIAESSERYR